MGAGDASSQVEIRIVYRGVGPQELLKRLQGRHDVVRLNGVQNKDEMRALVLAWPALEMLRGMNDMLHAIQDHRACGPHIQEPFDAQDILTMGMEQHAQPDAPGDPIERAIKAEGEGTCLSGMAAVRPWSGRRHPGGDRR